MRCWWCGAEPIALHDITTFGDPAPHHLPRWPAATDHEHAEAAPTSGQLEQSGHETLARIQRLTWPSTR